MLFAFSARLQHRPATLTAFKCDVQVANDACCTIAQQQSVCTAGTVSDEATGLEVEAAVNVGSFPSDQLSLGVSTGDMSLQ